MLLCIIAAWCCVNIALVDAKRGRGRKACFRNEVEAASVGGLLLSSFFRDLQASRCKPDKIVDVYRKYNVEDFPFSVNGEVLV